MIFVGIVGVLGVGPVWGTRVTIVGGFSMFLVVLGRVSGGE